MTHDNTPETMPCQPTIIDKHGVERFRENLIVRYLLDNGPFDMNHIAIRGFPDADQEQFAQLIGYSVSGFGDLSYVTDETYDRATRTNTIPALIAKARTEALEEADYLTSLMKDAAQKLREAGEAHAVLSQYDKISQMEATADELDAAIRALIQENT